MNNKNKQKKQKRSSVTETTPAEERLGKEKRYEGVVIKKGEDVEAHREEEKRSSYHD